ncbi:hemagglutinin [Mycoplasmoides gallisepticum]|uniref:hemagglutinin n=1 Tax=Mycoplasmoides gallisepticum TaxID=2096 RepID=UPI0039178FF4
MKRKNILKFVSLLGIGSFVMLAAASCTSATTPTPNPEPKPTPNPEPKPNPMPNPGGGDMNNPPSGGMNGGDTNPGNDGGMDNAAQQLAATRTALTNLLSSKNANVEMYSDYAKIKNDLTAAYTTAETALQNQATTLEQVKNATSTLQAAIAKAANDKKTFDDQNPELVTSYAELKTNLSKQDETLSPFAEPQFEGIKNHLTALYTAGTAVVKMKLQSVDGMVLDATKVNNANKAIIDATNSKLLMDQKNNATDLGTMFVKQILSKSSVLTNENVAVEEHAQPVNYSFVAYSVDIHGTDNNTPPSWNYTKRTVFTVDGSLIENQNGENGNKPLTDVSWVYSLGASNKYSLKFSYFGPSTGYLYFPYKLVKADQAGKIGLEYSLNGGAKSALQFAASVSATDDAAGETHTMPTETTTTIPANSDMVNPAPAVNDIKIAKVTLSELKFGDNTIEFTVPDQKVAPMFGNFYLTSNANNSEMIYNDIFGNSLSNDTVTVNVLKGYNLASDYSTYFAEYKNMTVDDKDLGNHYLIGFIGGNNNRSWNKDKGTPMNSPVNTGSNRTFTLFVNAPQNGDYYVGGVYRTSNNRTLKLWTTSDIENFVQFDNLNSGSNAPLKTFDSKTMDMNNVSNNKRTIKLKKGLNKITLGSINNSIAPNLGNLTFTLMPSSENQK